MTRRPTFRAALIQTAAAKLARSSDMTASEAVESRIATAASLAGITTAKGCDTIENMSHTAWRRLLATITRLGA